MQHTNELSESERQFREKRSQVTMEALKDILGNQGPGSLDETPTIAVAISGGGYRAVSTCCGAMEALMENGLFDALMYCVGLSGSVWYMSSTYSRKSFSNLDMSPSERLKILKKRHDWIRAQLGKKIKFGTWRAITYAFKSMFKKRKISLVDVFGDALKDILLDKEHKDITLSSLKDYVEEATVPFPIFSTARVRNNFPFLDFWEEVELNPFEATYASYRRHVPIERVKSIWKNGKLSEIRDEPTLHYIMGCCGCAFAILLYHIEDEHELTDRDFWNSWDDILERGVWAAIEGIFGDLPFMPFAAKVASGELPVDESVLSEEEFERTVWEPVLAKGLEDEGEEITLTEAYKMYLDYMKSDDRHWITKTIKKMQPPAGSSQPLDLHRMGGMKPLGHEIPGRNIGPFRRTGFLSNPLYGMPESIEKYMMNDRHVRERDADATKRIGEMASTENKDILVIDSGLGCNVPAIHVARPQRNVDVILVVDCEMKTYDVESKGFLGTLSNLQRQMTDNNMKFPTIDVEKIKVDHEREYYLFEDVDDPYCPIVIWFTLYNKTFRKLRHAERSNEYPPENHDDGKNFNDFDVTPDRKEYSTTNLQYSARDVDRLRELMRHNIKENTQVVKDKIAQKVLQLRSRNLSEDKQNSSPPRKHNESSK